MDEKSVDSSSRASESQEGSHRSEDWEFGSEAVEDDTEAGTGSVHTEESFSDHSHESEQSVSLQSEHSDSAHRENSGSDRSEHSGSHDSMETDDVAEENSHDEESSTNESEDNFDESQTLRRNVSDDSESHQMRSDDETDTCLLSIDEHVRRRYAKATLMRIRSKPLGDKQEFNNNESEDDDTRGSKSDDGTDTCILSIDEHVKRRQAKWKTLRDKNETEAIDLTCLDSYVGTLEETTVISVHEESVESTTADSRTMESLTMDSATFGTMTVESRTVENLPPVQPPRVDNKQGLDWRLANWRNENRPIKDIIAEDDRALNGVDYMSAFEVASTNRDISVVEPGISKKAAREAFEKKEVPDEIPMMLRDDVSSIYPPIRPHTRSTYPLKRKREPYNGMILEDPVSYDEELGDASTKEYEMSIVGSEAKKKDQMDQRSDIELVLIGMISLSLLILVILLIVILAKNS